MLHNISSTFFFFLEKQQIEFITASIQVLSPELLPTLSVNPPSSPPSRLLAPSSRGNWFGRSDQISLLSSSAFLQGKSGGRGSS